MADNLLLPLDAEMIILFPVSSYKKLSGTVKDNDGDPLVRKISVHRENPIIGLIGYKNATGDLAADNVTESESDGTFEIGVNETQPVTVVVHGESGENDQIVKGVTPVL